MPGMLAMRATRSSTLWRSSGSPPVSRIFWMPRLTARRTTRSISSKERMCGLGHPLLHDGRRIGQVRPVAAIEVLRRLGFRQAIEAAEIAAVRDAHPQVAQNAAVRINEQPGLGHLAGGLVAAGRLVKGGMTLTEPSALTSTLRS